MKNISFEQFCGLLNEDRSLIGMSIEDALVAMLSKKLKVSSAEAKAFLYGSGSTASMKNVLEKAKKIGYNEEGEGYDSFWQKIYTPVEYAIMMNIAAGDYNIKGSKIY